MDNKIVPFGKYKGQPLEVMLQDKPYLDWVMAQPWLKTQYAQFNTYIVNSGQEASNTPEHNKMQVRFLEKSYCRLVAEFIFKTEGIEEELVGYDLYFEESGIDVVLRVYTKLTVGRRSREFRIELKPTIADEFPAILRQMKNLKAQYLLFETYKGEGATWDEFEEYFKRSGILPIHEICLYPDYE